MHRDVKPGNLLLDGQERCAVADFGIAKLADDTNMTQTGMLLGTVAYLSPEQALGRPATAASDRYAFAVVIYELLTGARPFAGGPATAQLRQHAEAEPLPASEAAPGLPTAIDEVFARGLAKDPAERPATAAALVEEIELALAPAERTEPTRRMTPQPPPPVPAAPAIARGRPRETAPAPVVQPPPRRPPPAAAPADASAPAPGLAARRDRDPRRRRRGRARDRPHQRGRRRLADRRDDAQDVVQGARERTQTPAPAAPAAEEPSRRPPEAAAASDGDPAALNDQGFALNGKGSYAEAVPLLQQSVDGYRSAGRTKELNYAFALYNLGVALNRSGNPAAAVEVLQERLRYPNQAGTVRRELRDAQSKLDAGAGAGAGKKKDKDD